MPVERDADGMHVEFIVEPDAYKQREPDDDDEPVAQSQAASARTDDKEIVDEARHGAHQERCERYPCLSATEEVQAVGEQRREEIRVGSECEDGEERARPDDDAAHARGADLSMRMETVEFGRDGAVIGHLAARLFPRLVFVEVVREGRREEYADEGGRARRNEHPP